jgi:hypothetical protein
MNYCDTSQYRAWSSYRSDIGIRKKDRYPDSYVQQHLCQNSATQVRDVAAEITNAGETIRAGIRILRHPVTRFTTAAATSTGVQVSRTVVDASVKLPYT